MKTALDVIVSVLFIFILIVIAVLPTGAALAVSDCNGDGQDDAAGIRAGTSADLNGNGLPDECETAPLSFTPRLYPVGGAARAVEAADLDGDGRLDLAVWGAAPRGTYRPGLSVLLAAGIRGFEGMATRLARRSNVSAPGKRASLDAGDFDGDGDQDLALLEGSALRVIWNAGGGKLNDPVNAAGVVAARDAVVADFDQDGRADIACSALDVEVIAVFLGQSDSSFTPLSARAAGLSPGALAAGDMDQDGDMDIAAADRADGRLAVLLNDGQGVFAPPVLLETSIQSLEHAVLADLSGDGRLDLAVMSTDAAAILPGTGRGAFSAPVRFAFEAGANAVASLAAGDFDQDGDLDLIAGLESGAHPGLVLVNGGRGLIVARAILSQVEDVPLAARDLDGDGRCDVVTRSTEEGHITVLWNSDTEDSPALTFERRNQSLGFEPHASVLEDLDGDGDLDLAVTDGEWNVNVLSNMGNGSRWSMRTYSLQHANELISLSALDLNGDGSLDLVSADEFMNLQILLNEGQADFHQGPTYRVGQHPWFVTTADINGDGLRDVVCVNQGSSSLTVLTSTGDGRLRPLAEIRVGSSPLSAAAADLDGDGDTDLVVACRGSSQVTLLWNDAKGVFRRKTAIDVDGVVFALACDLNGDARPDIVAASAPRGEVLVFSNEGEGRFSPPSTFEALNRMRTMAPADLNGDGLTDIVTANEFSNSVSVLVNQGGGRLSQPEHYRTGYHPRFVVAGDIDQDGDCDLISSNHSSLDLTVLRNTSPRRSSPHYLERICTEADFHAVSIPATKEGRVKRLSKFLVPARGEDPSLLPVLLQNVRRHSLHQGFLAEAFPDRFGSLSPEAYDRLTGRRASRSYFAGVLYLLGGAEGQVFGFSVLGDFFDDPAELILREEVSWVRDRLSEVFSIGPLVYYPDSASAREDAAGWQDPGFPVDVGERQARAAYEVYTPGTGCGRLRILTLSELEALNEKGGIGFKDILVLDRAPRDIECVLGGVITGEPQGELSHVAVRTARRGTPNAYVADAVSVFAPHAGRLVRLETKADGYSVEPASEEEAAAWWAASRPRLSLRPVVDPAHDALDSVQEMDLTGRDAPPEARHGGKATNFARLQHILTGPFERYRERGFAVPMSCYLDFMRSNRLPSARDPGREVTYLEFLDEVFTWPEFLNDGELRFSILKGFREKIEAEGSVPAELVERLARRVEEVFGSSDRRVRFRSSSNIEDGLEFNGAGLYESTSACPADDLDDDDAGPSRCDAASPAERGIAKALKRVWASLWNARACEERAYYGIDHSSAAMGVLVSIAYGTEKANGVAFTGNPAIPGNRDYTVTAQMGEASVVSPDPGTRAERSILEVLDGKVVRIIREQRSSLAAPGEVVLSDDELRELGALLAHIDRNLAVEAGGYPREDVLLDIEFKTTTDGRLAVKQVRPFLRRSRAVSAPSFELDIPAGTEVCGAFVSSRPPREAYELKSVLRFAAGRFSLPAGEASFERSIIEVLLVGPDLSPAAPAGPGVFQVSSSTDGDVMTYRFRYSQRFTLSEESESSESSARSARSEGRSIEIEIPDLAFRARAGTPLDPVRVLDEGALAAGLTVEGQMDRLLSYAPCFADHLRLWRVEVELEDGSALELLERHEPPATPSETGPAALVEASVTIGGETRTVLDYQDLVYAAQRHNRGVRHWVVLKPPLEVPGLERPVHAIEIGAPESRSRSAPEARFLDERFERIAVVAAALYERHLDHPSFRRGDADGDGSVGFGDFAAAARFLFDGGAAPACLKAADGNDNGELEPADLMRILLRVFQYADSLPPPFAECGSDRTIDALSCEAYAPCGER
ncbi:MAG TPA: FG-GAP-like repeat-containing protein [Planctomycetota bacterium]|nr:FG-GAP-like repeat-containing protein [Planctomycetota bacterium]